MIATKELGAIAEDRSRIYWMLSRFFLDPPDDGFLAELMGAPMARSVPDGDGVAAFLAQLRQGAAEAAAGDGLRSEYLRLFRGLREGYGPPPPFESLHREGRMFGQSTEAVMDHYRTNGFSLAKETAGPEDHLGVELKYLALLCLRESQAWRDGDLLEGRDCLEVERSFIEQHLQSWVPGYCRKVTEEAHSTFYRAVAGLTAGAIDLDSCQVAGMLGEVSGHGMESCRQEQGAMT